MIRVNLLPQKRRISDEGGQLWGVVILVLLVLELVGLFLFHGMKQDELLAQTRKNSEIQSQIDQSRAAVQNHAEVKAQLERFRAREEAIGKLQNARTGPTAVLLELSRLLTPGSSPTVPAERLSQLRRENPLALFNPTWDARRLWITKYEESQRHVRLEGSARDGEDVSELARRLLLSSFFTDVKLLPAKKQAANKSGIQFVDFQLEATARY